MPDGSRDNTKRVIRERYSGERRVRYYRTGNRGTASARQRGLDRAKGRLVALPDSDDCFLPDCLASQVAVIDANPDADLVLCDARCEGPWGDHPETVCGNDAWHSPDSLEALANRAWAQPSCTMLRRATARRIGFGPEYRYAEHDDFIWRFNAAGCRLVLNPAVLVLCRKLVASAGAPKKISDWHLLEEAVASMRAKHLPARDGPDPDGRRFPVQGAG